MVTSDFQKASKLTHQQYFDTHFKVVAFYPFLKPWWLRHETNIILSKF